MLVIRILSLVFILAGVVLLGFGVSAYSSRRDFVRSASPARGTITEVIRKPSSLRRSSFATRYYYKIRFETERGETEFVNSEWHGSPEYGVGEEVPVLYQRDDPAQAAINSFSLLWFNVGLWGVLGACFLGSGLCNLWITATPAAGIRREAALRELRDAFRAGRLTRDSPYQGFLVAFTFVGFAFSGVAIMVLLFASSTLKFILAVMMIYMAVQIARGRSSRRRSRRGGGQT